VKNQIKRFVRVDVSSTKPAQLLLVRAALSILSVLGLATAAAQPSGNQEPLVLSDQGSFFVNEELTNTDFSSSGDQNTPGKISVSGMYVQYQIPEEQRPDALPVIMMHGSGHTGKTYEDTPDGRMGWAEYFVRQGFPVYVVDQVGRARSGFNPTSINQATVEHNSELLPPTGQVVFTLERAWPVFRFGPEPMVWYEGTQFPTEALGEYAAQLVPNTESTLGNPRESVDALAALLDQLGPSILFVHSQSGTYGMEAVVARPDLVKALVNVEGVCTLTQVGLESTSVDHDLTIRSFDSAALLTVFGDHVLDDAIWAPNRQGCVEVVDAINQNGGTAYNMDLPDEGLSGNTHMLMMDKNNLEVADMIVSWMTENADFSTAGTQTAGGMSGGAMSGGGN
jgi:pimeloyl-ACP methyl ester carboxylesterase